METIRSQNCLHYNDCKGVANIIKRFTRANWIRLEVLEKKYEEEHIVKTNKLVNEHIKKFSNGFYNFALKSVDKINEHNLKIIWFKMQFTSGMWTLRNEFSLDLGLMKMADDLNLEGIIPQDRWEFKLNGILHALEHELKEDKIHVLEKPLKAVSKWKMKIQEKATEALFAYKVTYESSSSLKRAIKTKMTKNDLRFFPGLIMM